MEGRGTLKPLNLWSAPKRLIALILNLKRINKWERLHFDIFEKSYFSPGEIFVTSGTKWHQEPWVLRWQNEFCFCCCFCCLLFCPQHGINQHLDGALKSLVTKDDIKKLNNFIDEQNIEHLTSKIKTLEEKVSSNEASIRKKSLHWITAWISTILVQQFDVY